MLAFFRAETATHTGQQWQDEDMRKMRYDYGSGGGVQEVKKEINVNFAIDWIKKQPVVEVVGKRRVACTGGGDPALGHPKAETFLCTRFWFLSFSSLMLFGDVKKSRPRRKLFSKIRFVWQRNRLLSVPGLRADTRIFPSCTVEYL